MMQRISFSFSGWTMVQLRGSSSPASRKVTLSSEFVPVFKCRPMMITSVGTPASIVRGWT